MRILGCEFHTDDKNLEEMIEDITRSPSTDAFPHVASALLLKAFPWIQQFSVHCMQELNKGGLRAQKLFYKNGKFWADAGPQYGDITTSKIEVHGVDGFRLCVFFLTKDLVAMDLNKVMDWKQYIANNFPPDLRRKALIDS